MKKYSFPRIRVLFSCVVFIALGLYFNAFNYLFIFYLLALIHELCHVIFALIFHVEVKEITFHALGFSAELKDIEFKPFYQQIIIYIAGPLSYFPTVLLINYLYKIDFLSVYSYKVALNDNLSLLIFNLLPFYPLDGGHIMEAILLKITNAFKAKLLRSIVSLFISIILLVLCVKDMQYLLFIFILYNAIMSLVLFKKEYRTYLLSRVGKVSLYPLKETKYPKLYHFYYNMFQFNKSFISEDDLVLKEEVERIKQKKKYKNP